MLTRNRLRHSGILLLLLPTSDAAVDTHLALTFGSEYRVETDGRADGRTDTTDRIIFRACAVSSNFDNRPASGHFLD